MDVPQIGSKEGFPTEEEYRELGMKILDSNKNLNRLMRKSADLKMWFDYLPRAKDFLVSAALWLFLLGLAISGERGIVVVPPGPCNTRILPHIMG
jgi:hypothetical protein